MPLTEGDQIKGKFGHYEVMEVLGDGCYATVYLVMDLNDSDSKLYALKAINKKHLKKNAELGPNLVREVKIHRGLDHINVTRFYKEFDDGTYIYFLLEFITPGEIYDVLYMERSMESESGDQSGGSDNDDGTDEPFSEDESRDYFFQIILALIFLRDKGIIHRDIKPENILLTEDGVIKLADFGWATSKPSDSIVGTPEYNAPEMVKGSNKYDYKSDLWSAGVVLFEFLYRKRPFHAKHAKGEKAKEKETEKRICSGKIPFPPANEDTVSEEARDLITKIFTRNPRLRPDYEQVLAHPWMMNWAQKLKVSEHSWMQEIMGHPSIQNWLRDQKVYSSELALGWITQYDLWKARPTYHKSSNDKPRSLSRSLSRTRSRSRTGTGTGTRSRSTSSTRSSSSKDTLLNGKELKIKEPSKQDVTDFVRVKLQPNEIRIDSKELRLKKDSDKDVNLPKDVVLKDAVPFKDFIKLKETNSAKDLKPKEIISSTNMKKSIN